MQGFSGWCRADINMHWQDEDINLDLEASLTFLCAKAGNLHNELYNRWHSKSFFAELTGTPSGPMGSYLMPGIGPSGTSPGNLRLNIGWLGPTCIPPPPKPVLNHTTSVCLVQKFLERFQNFRASKEKARRLHQRLHAWHFRIEFNRIV